jgi:hypothetical protein
MGTKVITVRVGREPSHTDFTVHEDPIRASSLFFQAAFLRPWRESQERIVRLPECDATAFQIYTHWLYSGLLCAIPSGASSSTGASSSLVRGYLLGDYLLDTNYKDIIMDGLVEWNKDAGVAQRLTFLNSWINIVDDKTRQDSPLRKLLVDITVWDVAHPWWASVIACQLCPRCLPRFVCTLQARKCWEPTAWRSRRLRISLPWSKALLPYGSDKVGVISMMVQSKLTSPQEFGRPCLFTITHSEYIRRRGQS